MTLEELLCGFKKVEVSDWPLIYTYLMESKFEESSHNIINLMMWKHVYPIWMKEGNNWLLLVGIHNHEWFLYMPLCRYGCVAEAICAGEELFEKNDIPYIMSNFTKGAMERILETDSDFVVETLRDSFDYIYEYAKLSTFSGKALQKKRNHINAFIKEYSGRYEYHRLQAKDVEDCLTFLAKWESGESDEFLKQECDGVRLLLQHIDELPYVGGVIRIDGSVEAFTIGSRLTDTMIQMNVEKANGEIRGLYPMICREYLAHEWADQGIIYVNREEDMGKENIRKAKESLYPAYLLEKYKLYRNK